MTVEETYRRTMEAEGRKLTEVIDYDKAQQYTLSNEAIREIYETNFSISERKNLSSEQMLDSFVLALVEQGMDMEEAEEVAEVYDRTAGEFFSGDNEDEDMPDPDEDNEWEDDEEIPPEFSDDEEEETKFYEV